MNRKRSVSYKTRSEAIKCCFQERLTFIYTRTGHVHFLTFDKVYFILCIVWIFQIIWVSPPQINPGDLAVCGEIIFQRLSLSHKLEKISTGIMAEKLILIVYLYICLSFIYGLYFVQVQIILSRLSQTNLLFQIRSNSEIHSIGEFESKRNKTK